MDCLFRDISGPFSSEFYQILSSFQLLEFAGTFKGLPKMASRSRTFTVDEILEYLDDNFDIPDDGLNSDIEGFEDEESDEDQSNFFPDPDIQTDDNEEEVTLAAVDIEESPARGRPRNTCVNEYEWSSEALDVNIPGFTQPIGQVNPLPRGSLEKKFGENSFWELLKGKQIATPASH